MRASFTYRYFVILSPVGAYYAEGFNPIKIWVTREYVRAVRGGVYGEMFPGRESRPDADGRVPLETPGADIEGLTSTDRILAEAADWVGSGLGAAVFPDSAQGGIEPGVQLESLFAA